MMFFQYFTGGATLPIMSLYLTSYLGFSGLETGLILSLSAAAALVSPFISALLADRYIDGEWLYGILHIIGAGILFVLFFQKTFLPVAILYFLYMLMYSTTESLSNSITFHHSLSGGEGYGGIRSWGTFGWIVVAWLFSFIWLRGPAGAGRLPHALILGSLSSCIAGIYAYTLPRAACKPEKITTLIPKEALLVFKKPAVWVFTLLSLCFVIIERYYYFGTSPFLKTAGFKESFIMPLMSLGQVTEVIALVLLSKILKKIGMKRCLLLGVFMQGLKFSAFAFGGGTAIYILGILCHGFSYAFTLAVGFVYLDSQCTTAVRTGTHQIFAIAALGLGGIIGNLLAGRSHDLLILASGAARYDWFWGLPIGMLVIVLAAVLSAFRESWWRKPQIPPFPRG